jgi:hypothetical protein
VKASNDEQVVGWGAIARVMDDARPPRSGGPSGDRWLSFRVTLGSVIYQAERYGIPLTQAMTLAARKFGEGTVRKALSIFPDDTSIAALHALDCLTNGELEPPDPTNPSK